MRLAQLRLNQPAYIPGWRPMLGGTDTTESHFAAEDGWDLVALGPDGPFVVLREGMPAKVVLFGYAGSYVEAPPVIAMEIPVHSEAEVESEPDVVSHKQRKRGK